MIRESDVATPSQDGACLRKAHLYPCTQLIVAFVNDVSHGKINSSNPSERLLGKMICLNAALFWEVYGGTNNDPDSTIPETLHCYKTCLKGTSDKKLGFHLEKDAYLSRSSILPIIECSCIWVKLILLSAGDNLSTRAI